MTELSLSKRIAKDLNMNEEDAAIFEAARSKSITERLIDLGLGAHKKKYNEEHPYFRKTNEDI